MNVPNWHTYQVLTKRPKRLCDLLGTRLAFAAALDHIWWGISVEDKKHGVPRIAYLREAPAIVRFLSIEPLLEDIGELDISGIHWVIVGGESGAGARSMKEEWVTKIRRQCDSARVPFFFKQWGGVRKSETGRELDGKTFDEMPKRNSNRIVSRDERRYMIENLAKWAAVTTSLTKHRSAKAVR